jgi:hypothetical protein
MHPDKRYIPANILPTVNRGQLGVVVLAFLAVVSLSIAAATIRTPVTTPGSGGGGSGGSANGSSGPPPLVPRGIDVPVFGQELEDATRNDTGGNETGTPPADAGNEDGGGVEVLAPNVPTTPLVLLAVVLVVGAVVALRNRGGDTPNPDGPSEPEPEPDDQETVGDIGQTAGEAATRITDTDATPENAIYNAWYEMTRHLDVGDPTTTTPGQFERAARDAGMDPSDVADLTTQFESVRYGDESLSDDRTDRAVSALRRIEAEYADGTEQTEWLNDTDGTEGEDG